MKPLYITLKNFKSFGDNEITIPLEENIVRIFIGKNGMGKTSIVEAIIWSLYGKSNCLIDEVVNRKTKKDCKVEFCFMIGKDQYNIIRYRNHTEHKNKVLLFINNVNKTPAKDVNAVIDSIIDMNYLAMTASVIFSSETYRPFLRSKGSDRLKIVEGILSMKIINRWADTTLKMRKPKLETIRLLKERSSKFETGISTIEKNIFDYRENVKKALEKLKQEKEQTLDELEETKARLNEYKEINHKEELKKNFLASSALEINNKNKNLLAELERKFENVEKLVNKRNELRLEIEEFSKLDINANLEKNNVYQETLQKNTLLKKEIAELRIDIVDTALTEKELEEKKEHKEKIEEKIKLVKTNECPTCGQVIKEEKTKELLKKLKEKLLSFEEKINSLQVKITNSKPKNAEILSKIEKLENQIIDISNIKKSAYSNEELLGIKDKKKNKEAELEILEVRIIEKEKFNKEISERIVPVKDELINDEDLPKFSKYEDAFLNNIESETDKEEKHIIEINERLKILDEKASSTYDKKYILDLQNKLEQLRNALDKNSKEILGAVEEDLYYDVLLKLFSNKGEGIKKYIIGKMIDVFNHKVNHYLPLFFDYNVEVRFDKNLVETIFIDGAEVSFDTFSSGEKTRLELSIAFSLFMLTKIFFSSSVDFIVFDEILDMNLDEEGVEAVLKIVNDLSSINSIIVISHREEYKENFPYRLYIDKDNSGFSFIREEVV